LIVMRWPFRSKHSIFTPAPELCLEGSGAVAVAKKMIQQPDASPGTLRTLRVAHVPKGVAERFGSEGFGSMQDAVRATERELLATSPQLCRKLALDAIESFATLAMMGDDAEQTLCAIAGGITGASAVSAFNAGGLSAVLAGRMERLPEDLPSAGELTGADMLAQYATMEAGELALQMATKIPNAAASSLGERLMLVAHVNAEETKAKRPQPVEPCSFEKQFGRYVFEEPFSGRNNRTVWKIKWASGKKAPLAEEMTRWGERAEDLAKRMVGAIASNPLDTLLRAHEVRANAKEIEGVLPLSWNRLAPLLELPFWPLHHAMARAAVAAMIRMPNDFARAVFVPEMIEWEAMTRSLGQSSEARWGARHFILCCVEHLCASSARVRGAAKREPLLLAALMSFHRLRVEQFADNRGTPATPAAARFARRYEHFVQTYDRDATRLCRDVAGGFHFHLPQTDALWPPIGGSGLEECLPSPHASGPFMLERVPGFDANPYAHLPMVLCLLGLPRSIDLATISYRLEGEDEGARRKGATQLWKIAARTCLEVIRQATGAPIEEFAAGAGWKIQGSVGDGRQVEAQFNFQTYQWSLSARPQTPS